jgi:hypothetical protein
MKTTEEHIEDRLADEREMAESEPKGWRRFTEPVLTVLFGVRLLLRPLVRTILPSLEVTAATRMTLDIWRFVVMHKGWFTKYRKADVYKIAYDQMLKLSDSGGWDIIVDEDRIEGMLRERIAREEAR